MRHWTSFFVTTMIAASSLHSQDRAEMLTQAEAAVSDKSQKMAAMATSGENAMEIHARQRVAELSTSVSTVRRSYDPFGSLIDGDFMKEVEESLQPMPHDPGEHQATNEPTFADALQTLRVVGLDLDARAFIVGSRRFLEGSTLTLQYMDLTFVVLVNTVSANLIVFEDVESGRKAVVRPNIIPAVFHR